MKGYVQIQILQSFVTDFLTLQFFVWMFRFSDYTLLKYPPTRQLNWISTVSLKQLQYCSDSSAK